MDGTTSNMVSRRLNKVNRIGTFQYFVSSHKKQPHLSNHFFPVVSSLMPYMPQYEAHMGCLNDTAFGTFNSLGLD